jgi:splicing factor 3A subunit 3
MEVLERQRNAHEDIERMEQAIVVRLAEEPRTRYDSLLTEHQVAQFLTGIQQQSNFLVESYRDENKYVYLPDGTILTTRARENEIESMSGSTNEFDQFYKQLAELKEVHRLHPNLQVEDLEKNYRKRSREEMEEDRMSLTQDTLTLAISNMFSGEESWGRFLDLTIYHERFLNLKGVRTNISYIDYLKTFQGFRHLRRQTKNDDYLKYLIQLQDYLESFLKRVQPVVNHEKLMNKIWLDFEKAWDNGTAPGQQDTQEAAATTNGSPLFCEACQKTYSKETVFNAHLDSKQHKKNVERANAEKRNDPEDDPEPLPGHMTREQRRKEISRREYTILKLCQGEKLSQIIPSTINNVERRALLSDRERQVLTSYPLLIQTLTWCRKSSSNYKMKLSIHLPKQPTTTKKTDRAMISFTIPLNSLWAGTVNPSHSGCINYTVLDRNIPVRFVEIWSTPVERILKNISVNPIIFMD